MRSRSLACACSIRSGQYAHFGIKHPGMEHVLRFGFATDGHPGRTPRRGCLSFLLFSGTQNHPAGTHLHTTGI